MGYLFKGRLVVGVWFVWVVLRRMGEKTTEHTESTETTLRNDENSGCPGFGSLLVDFGTFASVASVARDSLCGSRPKVLV